MYENIELISTVTHKNSALRAMNDFMFAKEVTSTPITIPEFYESCKDYPIVFIKNNDGWTASVILGYEDKVNLYINEEGIWEKGRYLPAFIRRYPFVFVAHENDQVSLAWDNSYKSEAVEDAPRRLFTEDGKNTEFLEGVLSFLNQYQHDSIATANFIKQLDTWGLLEEKTAQIVTSENKSYTVNGFFVVNEEKLEHLSDKKKNEIFKQHAIPLITAHLISLSNFQRMGLR